MNSECSEEECTVLGPVAAVLRLSRVIGTAPVRFEKQGTCYRVRFARCYSYHGLIFIVLGDLLMLWTMMGGGGNTRNMDSNVHNTGMVVSATLATVMVTSARRRMRCFIRTINKLQKIHMDLDRVWPKPWTRKQIASLVAWAVFDLAIFIVGAGIEAFPKKELYENQPGPMILFLMIANPALNYLYFWLAQLCQVQFILLSLAVRSGFSAVNRCLETLPGNTSPAAAHIAMRRISLAYATSCGAVKDVDRSHGAVLMLFFASIFMHLLTTPYFIIIRLLSIANDEGDMIPEAVGITYQSSQVVWCVIHLVNLVLMVEPCHLTYAEMENTRCLVSRLLQTPAAAGLAGELEQFRKQLALSRARYRPLSFVTMDRALVLKIVGSITTYLVVLVNLK